MKLRSALICLSLMLLAAPAFAQGQLFLNQGNCSATAPAKNKTLVCTSSTQVSQVFCSAAVMPADVAGIIADEGIVDIQVGPVGPAMPAFWQFNTGGCSGPANFLFDANFTLGPFDCADAWGGQASGGGQYGGVAGPIPDGSRARVKWSWAVTPDAAFVMGAGVETYMNRFTIRQAKALTCAGCTTPACCVFNQEKLNLLSGGAYFITTPDYVTFNDAGGSTNCPGATPAPSKTWGQVKALYR